MDKLDKNKIDELLPRYCEGQVTEEERLLVDLDERIGGEPAGSKTDSFALSGYGYHSCNEESRYGKSVVEGKRQDNR